MINRLFRAPAYLWGHRELLLLLIRRDFVERTSGTVLGFFWLICQPALQMLAFWFLMDFILKVRFPGRVSFLDYFMVAMLPWMMLNEAVSRGTGILAELGAVYRKVQFPVWFLPLVPLLVSALVYGAVYALLVAIVAGPLKALLSFIVVAGLVLWLVPVVYMVSVIGLFIRDFRQLVPFVLTLSMYLTPILYMPEMLPEAAKPWLVLNPVADLLACAHALLLNMPFAPGNLIRPWILWLVLLFPAMVLFKRTEPHMRDAL